MRTPPATMSLAKFKCNTQLSAKEMVSMSGSLSSSKAKTQVRSTSKLSGRVKILVMYQLRW